MRAYTADMIPGGASPVINVSQYDNDYAVTVTLIEGAEIYTPPSGATIMVEGTKPDGNGFSYACTYQGNVVTVPIYTQMTAVAGRFPIELVVYQSVLRVGSCNITLAVERAPLDSDEIISDSDIPAIIALAQAQADAAASSAASAETAKDAAMDAAQDAIDAAQELQTAIQFNAALIHETASGAVASFSDGADDIPMQSVVAEITPVQSGSGDPSPDNIRPISGRTGLTVTRANKNLAPNMAGTASTTSNGITFTYNDDGSITLNGTATASAYSRPVDGIAGNIRRPYGTYKKPVAAFGNNRYVGLFVQYQKSSSSWESVTGGGFSSDTFTLDEDYPLAIRIGVSAGTTVDNYRFEPYIYLDSVNDLTWVSPTKTDIPITWESIAGTVYGGTLDVVSGVLTVDTILVTVSSFFAENANWSNDSTIAVSSGFALAEPRDGAKRATAVTNMLPNAIGYGIDTAVGSQYTTTPCFGFNANDTYNRYLYARFPKTIGTTLAEVNAYLAENPLVIAYAIQTPQTYQLTPTEVRTLLGGNTIYTDAGDVSVEYIADTKMYIDNKIAELQALVLEN